MDRSTFIATPTGALHGLAAFSWDGSAWQPSGRAGSSVATTDGVLQGVAPFAWDGANWQPSGRAQSGVATPTGVLNGVAVYTWSGSAWTPTGGTASPSTPGGALRGVAAFSWDGSAWQPAGRAGPSVATPYGVLDGAAIFNWNGSFWAAGGPIPNGATLDLSFFPGTLDPRITFTRASTATYFDSSGTMQTAASGAPRFDYDPVTHALRGLLIEEARTNLAPNSGNMTVGGTYTPAASTIVAAAGVAPDSSNTMMRVVETAANSEHGFYSVATVAASTVYTYSLFAKAAEVRYLYLVADDGGPNLFAATFDLTAGTVSKAIAAGGTGTATAAAIQNVGSGIYRCSITGSLGAATAMRLYPHLSNVGSPVGAPSYAGNAANGLLVWGAQLEQGAFPTSYIPTTAAAVTRAMDVATIPPAGWFVSPGGSWSAEFISINPLVAASYRRIVTVDVAASVGIITLDNTASLLGQYDGSGAMFTANAVTVGAVAKGATTWTVGTAKACLNGGAVASSAALTAGYAGVTTNNVRFLSNATPAEGMSGYIRRVRYWPRVLSDAEMQSVTT